MIFSNNHLKDLLEQVSLSPMKSFLEAIAPLNRLTGTDSCDKAADLIYERLVQCGMDVDMYEFEGYFSDPIKSELHVITDHEEISIKSRPRSFSLNCPQGIIAPVAFDEYSYGKPGINFDEAAYYAEFKNKIVLSWNFYEDYVKKIEHYGAKGLIHIWTSDENVIHEETVGPIWGTPELENYAAIPKIPVVGIKQPDGLNLITMLKEKSLLIRIASWVDDRVATVRLPIATIPGETGDFVLVSGHYDSWYEGVTDNATGNAACLEIARVLAEGKKLRRTVKVAFWPGHSNGRYMGSTWYCDTFWKELYEHCIAHINIDSPGSLGGNVVLPRTTGLEGIDFLSQMMRPILGEVSSKFIDIPRGADQSFWGVSIPFHIMFKYEPIPEEKRYSCPGSGGGWWWHTEFDSLDKVDENLLIRDVKLNLSIVACLADCKRFPQNVRSYTERIISHLTDLNNQSDSCYDLSVIIQRFRLLNEKLPVILSEAQDDDHYNKIIMQVGGTLNELIYTAIDPFHFDNTFPAKLFPGIEIIRNIYRDNTSPQMFLLVKTALARQLNRINHKLDSIGNWVK